MAKYSGWDIIRMADEVPYEDLTKYQKKLVRKYGQPVSIDELERYSGVHTNVLRKRIDEYRGYGIDPSSIRYVRGEGYTAKTNKGKTVILYVVRTQNGQTAYFGSEQDILKAARDIEQFGRSQSPPIVADKDEQLIIPTRALEDYTEGSEKYQTRVERYLQKHPGATLKQARGHGRK